ncbi:MAG TPA: type II secretion system F family protein [Bryobacteraceae bacterium]|nr:type II secretion system F family protein [Bryobacteraceae bacterium]
MGFFVILIVVWLCAVAIWFLVAGAFRNADMDKIRQRLSGSQKDKKKKKDPLAPQLIHTEQTGNKLTIRLMQKYKLMDKLQEILDQAGLRWHPTRIVHACLACFLLGYVVVWSLADFRSVALIVGCLTGCAPFVFVWRKRVMRLRKFEEIFPESLEFVARSMRAGHAFSVSLEMLHREFPEPLSGEFKRTFEEHNLGLPLETALEKLAKRVPSLDVHFFVAAVMLQKRTGGNLAEILDKLAYVIRERFKLRGRIRAVSAHGKMTGMALSLIPVGVATILFYVNTEYAKFFFTDEVGQYMAGGAVALQLIGYGIIKKIVTIEI